MDRLSPDARSANMRAIHSRDTAPELVVRRLLHRVGYRYRIAGRGLPGKPDLVFPARRKVIFVHGCFWHQHPDCSEGRPPHSNSSYWLPKLARNQERDQDVMNALSALGWDAMVVWECQVVDRQRLLSALSEYLRPSDPSSPTATHEPPDCIPRPPM
ncbi:MAG: very short patch repair endonuclease [Candidatus Dormibacteria bacterium]